MLPRSFTCPGRCEEPCVQTPSLQPRHRSGRYRSASRSTLWHYALEPGSGATGLPVLTLAGIRLRRRSRRPIASELASHRICCPGNAHYAFQTQSRASCFHACRAGASLSGGFLKPCSSRPCISREPPSWTSPHRRHPDKRGVGQPNLDQPNLGERDIGERNVGERNVGE